MHGIESDAMVAFEATARYDRSAGLPTSIFMILQARQECSVAMIATEQNRVSIVDNPFILRYEGDLSRRHE